MTVEHIADLPPERQEKLLAIWRSLQTNPSGSQIAAGDVADAMLEYARQRSHQGRAAARKPAAAQTRSSWLAGKPARRQEVERPALRLRPTVLAPA